MSDQPEHDPEAALELIRAAHREGGRRLSDQEVIGFISRPIHILDGSLPAERVSGRGRKPKKTRGDMAAERRRGLYHRLVRLPGGRVKAAATRRIVGDETRRVVFQLCREVQENGVTLRREYRKEVKCLAARQDKNIPGDTRLTALINEFFETARIIQSR